VSTIQIPLAKWVPNGPSDVVTDFLLRPAFLPEAEQAAREILEDVRLRGDAAVSDATARFNDTKLPAGKFEVVKPERMAAMDKVSPDYKRAVAEAISRVAKFAKAGIRKDWNILSPKGGLLGEQFVPYERVGVYIPGGAAPLASTAVMTVAIAKVAGVQEIVACTPAEKGGKVNSDVLYALDAAGATEIYRIGGIQAIGAMAYGTKTIGRVQKIVGPGGPYVTAAKRLVYGQVDLDLVAGPSEVAILADDSAVARHLAADLLAQLEHGTGHERALLITPSAALAYAVADELPKQAAALPRAEQLLKVLPTNVLLALVDNLDIGMELSNLFAPEHLEIIVREPRMWLKKVKRAGAVFIGPWTPECVGDFVAGPSHVLPTGGAAALFSGLTVESFRRRTSYISFTRADLQDVLPVVEAFAQVEHLEAHARSAKIRFEK
jgi:histidinol dehydrogenase